MEKEKMAEFMNYLKNEFPNCFDNHFTYDLVENLVNYAYKTHGHSKGSARAIVCEILPEVDIAELERYLPDFSEKNQMEVPNDEIVPMKRKGGR